MLFVTDYGLLCTIIVQLFANMDFFSYFCKRFRQIALTDCAWRNKARYCLSALPTANSLRLGLRRGPHLGH